MLQQLQDAADRVPVFDQHHPLCCRNVSVQLMLGLYLQPDHPSSFFSNRFFTFPCTFHFTHTEPASKTP